MWGGFHRCGPYAVLDSGHVLASDHVLALGQVLASGQVLAPGRLLALGRAVLCKVGPPARATRRGDLQARHLPRT
jgi:hypothetical protein